jgi:CheY-like chemotaxis protein
MWLVSIEKRECMTQQRMVLIVDDEDICLSITSKMVEKIGLPVMTARDGVEALEIYQQHGHEIGCVLLDIQMPRMNGIEAFRRLKSICGNVQVVIASGFLYTTNQGLIESLKPAGYLKKPFTFDDLSTMVTKCLQAAGQPGPAEETAQSAAAASADSESR